MIEDLRVTRVGERLGGFCNRRIARRDYNARQIHIRARIVTSTIAGAVVTVVGTIGYLTIEGRSILDALYMTVVTVTTVGYDKVRPLSSAGKVFSIFSWLLATSKSGRLCDPRDQVLDVGPLSSLRSLL